MPDFEKPMAKDARKALIDGITPSLPRGPNGIKLLVLGLERGDDIVESRIVLDLARNLNIMIGRDIYQFSPDGSFRGAHGPSNTQAASEQKEINGDKALREVAQFINSEWGGVACSLQGMNLPKRPS